MKPSYRHLLTLVAAASLAACSSVKLDDVPVETRGAANASSTSGTSAAGSSSQTRVATVDVSANDSAAMGNLPRVVYFDYDSYIVKDEFRPVVEANAKALTGNPAMHLAVEGHTDDRGSSEYNLALGQRRAESVVKSLELLGAKPNQVEAVSFGKERPAVPGENEEAWAKNRRAELAKR